MSIELPPTTARIIIDFDGENLRIECSGVATIPPIALDFLQQAFAIVRDQQHAKADNTKQLPQA